MTNLQNLKIISNDLRKELILKHTEANMSHISADFSCLDILAVLYFKVLKKRDHFILSKGHAALALYSVLHKRGIINDKVYDSLGKENSLLAEHPMYGINGIEFATGSLGHGLSVAAGMAMAKKFNNEKGNVYVLLSDGECQEGSTLEAMNFSARMNLNNLVAIVDSNKWQAFDRTLISIKKIKGEFVAAGWNAIEINGHDYNQIYDALTISLSNKPTLVIAHTILTKGIKSIEDKIEWHYKVPKQDEVKQFIGEIE